MSGKDHEAVSGQCFDQTSDLTDLNRIQAGRRFVQQDDFRVAGQCRRETDALAVAFGKIPDFSSEYVGNSSPVRQFRNMPFNIFPDNTIQVAYKTKLIHDGHFFIESRLFRQISDQRPGNLRLPQNIMSIDLRMPGARCEPARKNLEQRRLPRAVLADQSDQFAPLAGKTDIVQRAFCAVCLADRFRLQHAFTSVH